MKHSFILFSAIALCCTAACNKMPQTSEEDPEYITLSLGVSGTGETKATATANLYGINVYYDSAKDGNIDAHYAYGVFDNIEDMKVTLLKGYHYRFACTLVKNGKNILYCGQYGGNTFSGYAKPFQRANSASTALSNKFLYKSDDDDYLSGIGSGTATLKTTAGYEDKDMPSLERYYGEVTDYTPVTGGVVTIPLKKTVFGVRFIIEPVPEGTLTASCGGLLSGTSSPGKQIDSGSRIYSFSDVRGCWLADDYTMNATVNWTFTSSVFSQYNHSSSRLVTFRRNMLTTVTVSYTPDNASAQIAFNEESLRENNIYLFVNSDGYIEVGIKPEPED
jgi:hypothetical protein